MSYIVKQGGRTDYNYKEFYLDSEADVASLPTRGNVCPGSVAYIIATGAVYMLNNSKQWIKQ